MKPGEEGSTVTLVFPSPTNLAMSFPIGLNGVLLRAFLALPLLLSVFSAVVLLDAGQVPERPGRVVVHAGLLGADVDLLPDDVFVVPLLELPWEVVASPV